MKEFIFKIYNFYLFHLKNAKSIIINRINKAVHFASFHKTNYFRKYNKITFFQTFLNIFFFFSKN